MGSWMRVGLWSLSILATAGVVLAPGSLPEPVWAAVGASVLAFGILPLR